MKDPHVHAEKCPVPGFGNAAIRELIISATGLVPSLPATVTTGCGRRRPLAMTSLIPEKITCLACREYAAGQLREAIASAESLLTVPDSPDWSLTPGDRAVIEGETRKNRMLLARYEQERSNG